ncbi:MULTISPECIES: heme ABC exporter ATP-binding protein CcmA [Streptomyces]|uniref:heme ABC exporter ATP-binding protein CcmA n=1 Tax=Streptomyces TaxID=1883 RepID=UPI002248C0D5|nr:heme ABC exporter ATP-binding protein CcmA [Streptomyces sp. JHD 1]MCX2968913.1 heme ABC exporter ATP-binding protein CcmA [Streptomyces sp. JHD 1]
MAESERGAALLAVREVAHRYGEREVLHGVSLTVAPGECVALVGPNGCGKSTLLRLAAGRERPTAGRVVFDGAEVDEDEPATRARIAAVLDAASFYPDLTVGEHLRFVALAHGLRDADAEAAVARELSAHRLTDRADALPAALSSGQTQALLLATAFVRPHALLLLDEPEQRLDARARARLTDRLRAHARRGAAVLLATHDARLTERAADRVLALESGRPAAPPEPAADPHAR